MKFDSLRFEKVSFGYDAINVFENVDFEFPMNQNVWVDGKAGRGKSTLLRVLSALSIPQAGHFYINDLDVTEVSFEEFIPYRLEIGYSMDFGGLLSNRTLRENLILSILYHRSEQARKWTEWVETLEEGFGLARDNDQRPAAVTGSQRKATCVARAFVLKPQLLLLDNPTVGLGNEQRRFLSRCIQDGREEGWLKHCFISTNDERFVADLVDSKVLVDGSHISLLECHKESAA